MKATAVPNECSTAGASDAWCKDDLPEVSSVGKEMGTLKFFPDARQHASPKF